MQDQIDASVDSAIERARSRMPAGESLEFCEDCDEAIPEARRKALPGVRCQRERDEQDKQESMYNRRGSKDSQLK